MALLGLTVSTFYKYLQQLLLLFQQQVDNLWPRSFLVVLVFVREKMCPGSLPVPRKLPQHQHLCRKDENTEMARKMSIRQGKLN